jgi:hypothetical protein
MLHSPSTFCVVLKGGLFGGICSSLATIPSANICGSVVKLKNKNNAYDDKSRNKSETAASYIARPKKVLRRGRLLRYCQVRFFPKYSCGRWEWIIRSIPLVALVKKDQIIRLMFL